MKANRNFADASESAESFAAPEVCKNLHTRPDPNRIAQI
jgi:hypothetical protein